MRKTDNIVDVLARLALFSDLSRPQLEAVAHTFDEERFHEGQRILRQGLSGSSFYVILEGEASVRLNGRTLATLAQGDFFGEISVLLGEPPVAEVMAATDLRCLMLPGQELEKFLLTYPHVMFRMLQAEARRVRNANVLED